MQSTISFYGGAGSVTGSNFLLDTGSKKILVDCGLQQGQLAAEAKNWEPFPFDPKTIDVLVNTHAHIDHIGRIPKLVKDGFRGHIISTDATKALAEPLLLDAMELLHRTAEHLGKAPLYEEHDITETMRQWQGISYHQPQELGDDVVLELLDAGHILGSAMAKFSRGGSSVVFSGDLGSGNSPLLPPCEVPQGINYLLVESVYGDRVRPDDEHHRDALEAIIEDAIAKQGTLLIPAFSTERTQDIVFDIRTLMLEKRIPLVPVYLDSPLAEKITTAYLAHPKYFSDAVRTRIESGEQIFSFPELKFIHDARESEQLSKKTGAKILIAGSGMSNGGRVLAHEREILPDQNSTVLIVGYQAAGSLGRKLVEGAKSVDIHKEKIAVRARVKALYGYSAHMDSQELLEFVNKVGDGRTLREVFVVMGEPASEMFLAQRIRDFLGIKALVPEAGTSTMIDL